MYNFQWTIIDNSPHSLHIENSLIFLEFRIGTPRNRRTFWYLSDLSYSTHFGVGLYWIIYPTMNYGVIHISPHTPRLASGKGVIFNTQN